MSTNDDDRPVSHVRFVDPDGADAGSGRTYQDGSNLVNDDLTGSNQLASSGLSGSLVSRSWRGSVTSRNSLLSRRVFRRSKRAREAEHDRFSGRRGGGLDLEQIDGSESSGCLTQTELANCGCAGEAIQGLSAECR